MGTFCKPSRKKAFIAYLRAALSAAERAAARATLPWLRRMARHYHCSVSTVLERCVALTAAAWEQAGRPP